MDRFPLSDMPEDCGDAVLVEIEIIRHPGSHEMRANVIQIVQPEPSEFEDDE